MLADGNAINSTLCLILSSTLFEYYLRSTILLFRNIKDEHRQNTPLCFVNQGVPYPDVLAKYAAAFLRNSPASW
jgi:hypothetical protein